MRKFKFAAAVAVILGLAILGPAAKGEPQAATSPLLRNIQVGTVSGGAYSNPAWGGYVHNNYFASMLRQALNEHGLLAQTDGRFVVSATLISFRKPDLNGFNFDGFVRSEIRYLVTTGDGVKTVFETTVMNTVRVNSHPGPSGRIRRTPPSDEKSVGRNISQFVKEVIARSESDPAFRGN